MKFLGVRVGEHDSNITYTDGVVCKYFKPERTHQIKHFAYNDIFSWLESSKVLNFKLNEIDAIGLVLDTYQFPWLGEDKPEELYRTINIPFQPFDSLKCPIFKIDHHYAHSLSSWMLADNSDIDFVFDGYGDLYKSCSVFKNKKLNKYYDLDQVYSFGKFLSDECAKLLNVKGMGIDLAGKIMALQSYGKLNKSFLNSISKYSFEESKNIYDINLFVDSIGSKIVAQHQIIDFVKTVHNRMEQVYLDFFTKETNEKNIITYSGGIAQNICINTKLKQKFTNLVIPPHCADEGLSLGCVEFMRQYFKQPNFNTDNFPFWQSDTCPKEVASDKVIKKTAELLAQGNIIGWYQGFGEIGPRALGHRSILMSPEIKNGKAIINEKVKHREDYRPFAASIKLNKTKEYFNWEGESPFMLYSVKFKDKIFNSISHIDNTSRIQTVKDNQDSFYRLLDEFEKLTGLPMLLNTSLNDNGKPIAGHPNNAINLLKHSDLNYLIIGNLIFNK